MHMPQHVPKIILGVLLSHTLDIKIAHLVLIFSLVLHAPNTSKKRFIITYFETAFYCYLNMFWVWHPGNNSVMSSFLWRLYVRFYSVNFFPKNLTHEKNNTQHLNMTTILSPLYLRNINDCFCIFSKHTITQKLKIFR